MMAGGTLPAVICESDLLPILISATDKAGAKAALGNIIVGKVIYASYRSNAKAEVGQSHGTCRVPKVSQVGISNIEHAHVLCTSLVVTPIFEYFSDLSNLDSTGLSSESMDSIPSKWQARTMGSPSYDDSWRRLKLLSKESNQIYFIQQP